MNVSQRLRLKEIGKGAFIREEMTRLGFWPPSPEVAARAAEVEAQLGPLYEELIRLRTDLTSVEAEISASSDVTALLAEVRRKRIERVRAARAVRKTEREQARIESAAQDKERRRTTLPFLGVGVSNGLVYENGDTAKISERALPLLETASDIARAIGITEQELAFLTYHRGASGVDHYARFTIPKKRGSVRVLSSPKPRLRVAQGWLLRTLEHLPVHRAAMAFRPALSVADNAKAHQGRAVVVRVDLKDFFPSIGLPRVKALFQSFGYNGGVATILALLATESPRAAVTLADGKKRFVALGGRVLPQGACTSPILTNLLCRRMDARLAGASDALKFTYTRYADDLVFSHREQDAPVAVLLALIERIVTESGFVINREKTAVMRPQHRQVVTGVVVNETPHISRHDLRKFRAFLHQCGTKGADAMSAQIGKDALSYARGYLSFVHMVSPEQARRITAANPWLGPVGDADTSSKPDAVEAIVPTPSGGATGGDDWV